MMAFIISITIFFLALIVNESAIVGKTTSESVLEFPKADIQDLRNELLYLIEKNKINDPDILFDIQSISMSRKGAIVNYAYDGNRLLIHYNDGITEYNEVYIGT